MLPFSSNVIEQDHRALKPAHPANAGLQILSWAAQNTLARIEVMHMLKKGQLKSDGGEGQPPAEQFCALGA